MNKHVSFKQTFIMYLIKGEGQFQFRNDTNTMLTFFFPQAAVKMKMSRQTFSIRLGRVFLLASSTTEFHLKMKYKRMGLGRKYKRKICL